MRGYNPKNHVHGWLVLDKPFDITSAQALNKIKKKFSLKKIGHAGTLDPFATGILPVPLGEATKLTSFLMGAEKIYEFSVIWGAQTTTDDAEGDVIATSSVMPTDQEVENILPRFTGWIDQKPPAFSALKVRGVRAYQAARAGNPLDLEARQVHVKKLLYQGTKEGIGCFKLWCGKGTYVRSLARDMAVALGTRGFVKDLRRVQVGPFQVQNSLSLEKVLELEGISGLKEKVHALSVVLDDILVVVLQDFEIERLKKGQFITRSENNQVDRQVVGCQDKKGRLHCIGCIEGGLLKPTRVFNCEGENDVD